MELIHLIISFFFNCYIHFLLFIIKIDEYLLFFEIRNFLIYENAFTAPSLQST